MTVGQDNNCDATSALLHFLFMLAFQPPYVADSRVEITLPPTTLVFSA